MCESSSQVAFLQVIFAASSSICDKCKMSAYILCHSSHVLGGENEINWNRRSKSLAEWGRVLCFWGEWGWRISSEFSESSSSYHGTVLLRQVQGKLSTWTSSARQKYRRRVIAFGAFKIDNWRLHGAEAHKNPLAFIKSLDEGAWEISEPWNQLNKTERLHVIFRRRIFNNVTIRYFAPKWSSVKALVHRIELSL